MKKSIGECLRLLAKAVLALRYKVEIRGLDVLSQLKKQESKKEGILFLPNHVSELDPVILLSFLNRDFHVAPLVAANIFDVPFVGFLLKLAGSISIPNVDFGGNEYTRLLANKALKEVADRLNQGQNFLIYPSGKLKNSGLEILGGASGVHQILQESKNAHVVLIRTTGLWGSMFSKAFTGTSPDLGKTLLSSLKQIFLNGIFFMPRRKVLVEISLAPDDFPRSAPKMEFNAYLERWYNAPFAPLKGEPLEKVARNFWSDHQAEINENISEVNYTLSDIPKEIQESVIQEISRICKKSPNQIDSRQELSRELGMDSLDVVEIIAFLDDIYGIKEVQPGLLTTVLDVMWVATHPVAEDDKEVASESAEIGSLLYWPKEVARKHPVFERGNTLPEVLLRSLDRGGKSYAIADDIRGALTYAQVKMAVILLASELKKFPGKEIGILLPASVTAQLLIFACFIAKKVPVMLNWTIGAKNLREIAEASSLQVILTSAKFLSQAKTMDVEGIESLFVIMEDFRKTLTLPKKVMAWYLSKKKADSLLAKFNIDDSIAEEPAALLFTSGTESTPKGVPLSHKNILSNQRAAFSCIDSICDTNDVFYSFLPPFHSFGFVVTGMIPIFTQIRVTLAPDPTDSLKIVRGIQKWQASIVCSTPTFLKAILRKAHPNQLATLKLIVTGAEKAPQQLFEDIKSLGNGSWLLEGYGITECSPILTLNYPGEVPNGVGKPLPGVELLIVGIDSHQPLPPTQEGLILARGPNIFKGYWQKNLRSPFLDVAGKSWYVTGDLGYLTENGSLILSGRLKRFVKMGGEMINLLSIEEVLLQAAEKRGWKILEDAPSLALIAREVEGERPLLILYTLFNVSVNEVNEVLREARLSLLIKISEVIQIESIPLLGTGKVNYRALSN